MKLRDHLEKILSSQIEEAKEQAAMRVTLDKLTDQVEYHIKRTDRLEDIVVKHSEFQARIQGAAKLLLGSAAVAGAIAGILKVLG